MKKLFVVLLALALLCASSVAEGIDLSGMSFDELVALRQQVDQAIMQSDGWQEVEVPAGVYTIGEDIPAGRWSVSASSYLVTFTLYPEKSDYTNQTYNFITTSAIQSGDSYTLECSDGNCLEIGGGSMIFRPYTGAALGFK